MSTETTAAIPVRSALERHPGRPVYPYSVIRGGVRSAAEFEAALRHDSVASAHYAGFRRESVQLLRASSAMPMYASYRIGNNVYWTSHRIHIATGETLIADGTNLARARCGNRLSDSPREPVARIEPAETEMDTPDSIDFTGLSPGDLPPADSGSLGRLFALPAPTAPSSALAFELFPLVALSAAPVSELAETPALSASVPPMAFRDSVFKIRPLALPLVPGSIKYRRPPTTTSQPPTLTDEPPPLEPEPPVGNPRGPRPGGHDVPEPVAGVLFCAGLAFLWIAAKRLRRRDIA